MRIAFTILLIAFLQNPLLAQTITVGGQCMGSNIILNKIADVNGRSAYQATGTVDGIPGVTISVYWLGSPDNVWVLDFDGQPFYYETCNTSEPTGTSNGSCPWTEVTPGDCTGGTPLYVSGLVSLPVELVDFSARKNNNNDVDLKWKTSLENNNKGFDVQRSSDAASWNTIGFVNGKGNSTIENNYLFTDKTAPAGKNYYRLLQIDYDGNKKYSSIAYVDLPQKAYYAITNNPGKGIYQIRIASAEKVELSVLDLSGRRLLNKTVGIGMQEINISAYPAGTYLLQLRRGDELITEKLVKQ
ncbi:MAG: T9SS type A sorting domain-containing protein [Chitinophagaceae bacterium]|nr:T9SS type A sorting domain-containing protein [Chitinophagaceae bacterium]